MKRLKKRQMKMFIRNFMTMLGRFKMAGLLNVLGLGVAFAAFTIIMIQLTYDWGYDRFHKNADCIYRVEMGQEMIQKEVDQNAFQAVISRPFAEAVIRSSPHIVEGALEAPSWGNKHYFTLIKNGSVFPHTEELVRIYPSFTRIFDFQLMEGTLGCLEDKDQVLMPESMSHKLFGQASAIGQVLHAEGRDLTVGGVFRDFPPNSMVKNVLYVPFPKDENLNSWGNQNYYVYLQLDSPESKEQVVTNFETNFKMEGEHAGQPVRKIQLTQLTDVYFDHSITFDKPEKGNYQSMALFLALAFLILAVACINFTNFSTALTPLRIRSVNTQKVLGSSDWFLRWSFLMEAVCISFVSFLFSLLLLYTVSFTDISHLLVADISLGANVGLLMGVALLSLVVGVVAGSYPAYYMVSFSPALVLKGTFGLSSKGKQLRNVLISIQFIAAISLIIAALFMYLQNSFMLNVPLGFDKDQVVIVKLNDRVIKSKSVYPNKLKSFAGIDKVTFAESLISSSDSYMGWGRDYKGEDISFTCLPVSPSFLDVMGIPVLEGRDFREEDESTKNGALIFNEKARKKFGLELGEKVEEMEIVGFIPDIKFTSLRLEVSPLAFYVWNWGTLPRYSYIKVKAGTNMREAVQHIRTTLTEMDEYYPFELTFFDEVLDRLYEKEQKTSSLVNIFALLAVVLAIVGVFGLVVFESQYRRKEIAIRKVHGGDSMSILVMFNQGYVRILLVCFAIATPIAYYGVTKWLENFAYKTPIHVWVFLLAFAIIVLITTLTVSIQSWKAANENPAETLTES